MEAAKCQATLKEVLEFLSDCTDCDNNLTCSCILHTSMSGLWGRRQKHSKIFPKLISTSSPPSASGKKSCGLIKLRLKFFCLNSKDYVFKNNAANHQYNATPTESLVAASNALGLSLFSWNWSFSQGG